MTSLSSCYHVIDIFVIELFVDSVVRVFYYFVSLVLMVSLLCLSSMHLRCCGVVVDVVVLSSSLLLVSCMLSSS